MIDLKDMTFTIPVKIDHQDRADNLKVVVDFLSHNFETNIIVCEQDTEMVKDILEGYNFTYIKTKRKDGLIHRTYQLNLMANHAKTPYIANYDADVLFPLQQYVQSMQVLRENKASFVLPYGGPAYNIGKNFHQAIFEKKSIDPVGDVTKNGGLMNRNSVGGAIFWNKKDFIEGGMENQHFIAWGFEDNERFDRFKKLGYKLARVPGDLYHLTHYRSPNSNHTHVNYHNNQKEFQRIASLPKETILQEMKTWSWLK